MSQTAQEHTEKQPEVENDVNNETKKSWLDYIKLITVEPTMVFYMMAFMTTSVVEQAFFVDKACKVDHGFNSTVCNNLTADEFKPLKEEVQITVSNFHLWNDVAGHGGPIVLAFFMGAWSDKRGRKLPLLMGLFGKLYYSAMIVLIASQPTWPLKYVIYFATLPMAFTGADVAIFAASFTYLIDITTQKNRTMRVTLLEVCYLATMPSGIALGKYLFSSATGHSYSIMFAINCAMMVAAILYSLIRLEWRTTGRQRPLSEAANIITDFFDHNHVVNTFKTLLKKRPYARRTYLLALILMMALYTFQRDEKSSRYLYLQFFIKWTFEQISDFSTFQSSVQDVFLLVSIPIMSRYLGWRDTIIIMIGASAHAFGRIFYATATVQLSWLFYVGGVFTSMGPIVAPVIRSMVSKMVATSEKGRTFSVLAVADNAIPLVSGTAYSKLYNATIRTSPNAIFYLTMATQLAVFALIFLIHVRTNDTFLVHEDEENDEALEKHEDVVT